ncbi:MBL fold metallo-hydrolase [Desulfobacterota bacterium AH_259_B03_O07]|nr:MBL fold metallo-hydrolase [Desulfobacterota bacterium AH_259_B03_O07]
MKVIILGCATSTGVPIIGCGCSVCNSQDPRNKRTRCSILVQTKDKNILVDTSPDLRIQAFAHQMTKIDAVLYTHSHADHTHGIDELRTYNFINKTVIPCYGDPQTVSNIKSNFKYIFDGSYSAGGKPKLEISAINGDIDLFGITINPIEINHADWIIYGYRIGNMAYLTDCSGIPDESKKKLNGLDLLILDALRINPHPAHLSVDQAIETSRTLSPKETVFTHMSHELDYNTLLKKLPQGIEPGYDGMEFELDDP